MVIENGTIRKHGYGFLFAFYSTYGLVLYHFRDNGNRDFHTPRAVDSPVREVAVPLNERIVTFA